MSIPMPPPPPAAFQAPAAAAAQQAPAAPVAPQAPAAPAAPEAPYEPVVIDQEPAATAELVPYVGEPAGELPAVVEASAINWSGDFKEIAAQQGFEDLDFTAFGIWPICSLDRGTFKLSSGGNLGTEFFCRVLQKRKKTLFDNGVPYGKQGAAAVYSYDGVTASGSGKPLKELTKDWGTIGKREYLELVCQLQDDRIVLLSVPPQSVSRFVAFFAETITARIPIAQALCRVHIGEEVTKAAVPFNPLGFELVRR